MVGLGNPGFRYEETRHNVGFSVVDHLAKAGGWSFHSEALGSVEAARVPEGWLMKPQGYMNCSGEAVAAWIRYYKIPAEAVLVVVDDVAVALGTLRLRGAGSCGGHNGLRSMEEALGSDQYARLRCGVGPCPENRPLEVFVLERFSEVERPVAERMVKRAAEAVRCCQTEGMEIAMNTFNRKMEEV